MHILNRNEEQIMTNKASKIVSLVESAGERIFSVKFVKVDGSERTMVCRRGVVKHSNGGEAGYAVNPDNIGVFEMGKEGGRENYRCFNANRVVEMKVGGVTHNFDLED